jgi:hypothetical protein
MADDDKHEKIGKIKDFCPVAGKPCKCPQANNYRDNCEPNWGEDWQFAQGTTGKSKGDWQAHHVLSISCVNWLPNDPEARAALKRVLEVTVWCINNKENMLAMPMFGMTVMHYTDVEACAWHIVGEDFQAPPFKNIPQHDFEHNTTGGYCTEVKAEIAKLWDQISEAVEEHLKAKEGIAQRLKDMSTDWKFKLLMERGLRHGGTQNGWEMGIKSPESDWYLPFSMANDGNAEKRYFPLTVDAKLEAIRESLRSAGQL